MLHASIRVSLGARFSGGLVGGTMAGFVMLRAILGTGTPDGAQPSPRWPNWRQEYPSAYRGVSVTHGLLSRGLLGMGRRLRDADVLLSGSSHAEFGFSAAELSADLRRQGVSAKAYNIGVGWGEGFAFPAALIDRHDLRHKVIIVELFRVVEPLTEVGRRALHDNAAAILVRVFNTWLSFAADRALDGILAQLETKDGQVTIARRLDQSLIYRRWADGDVSEYWTPERGRMYFGSNQLFYRPDPNAKAEALEPSALRRTLDQNRLRQRDLTLFVTFIPFVFDSGRGHLEAAEQIAASVIPIRGDKVELCDGAHTNVVGRTIVTDQIAAALFAYFKGTLFH